MLHPTFIRLKVGRSLLTIENCGGHLFKHGKHGIYVAAAGDFASIFVPYGQNVLMLAYPRTRPFGS